MKPKNYFFLTIIVVVISGLLSFLCLFISILGKVPPRTYLLHLNYSGFDRQQFASRVYHDFPLPQSLQLQYQDQSFSLPLASISAQIDLDQTSALLFPNLRFSDFCRSLFTTRSYPLQISYDPAKLAEYLSGITDKINQPFVPAELKIVTNPKSAPSILTKPGQLGLEVDSVLLEQSIINLLSHYQIDQSVPVSVNQVGKLPTSDQLSQTKTKAENLLHKSLLLSTPRQDTVSVDDQTLISWLKFDDSYDSEKIISYISSLNDSLKKDPINAVFKFENGQVLEFTPSQDGFTLDQSSLLSQLQDKLTTLVSSSEKSLSLDIPTNPIPPQISTGSLNDLGIKELLGRGVSTFKHSSAIRNFNIEKGASIVNRILVTPGEEFSFIKNLGEVTLEAGFKKAYIIRQGKTELDVGGGICQVSTTLFRAMLNAGVDILERQNHAYRVSYYEEDMPPGYDATVFIPKPDLRFRNDTGHHLLVQNIYDGQNKKLTYEIYGTSDGRKVEISNYRRWGAAPPPPTVYIDDPTLPPGKLIKEETAVAGLKTAFDWKVIRGDQTIHQKTFQSNFVPWAAVYRRGPTP